MLIVLRSKFPNLSGRQVDNALVKADITVNKNMVPLYSRKPFQTFGLRIGTPAITTRGVKEDKMPVIVDMIDRVINDFENESLIASVKAEVNAMMSAFPLFAY